MALISKSTKSYVKENYSNSTDLTSGFKKVKFADKPGEGAIGILTSGLIAPTEMTANGFVQPSGSVLAGLRLRSLRDSLRITSSLRGELEDYTDYVVISQSKINFLGFTAEDGEFFVCTIDCQPANAVRIVDASSIRATGTILAGETEISVGAYQVHKYPGAQIGQLMVMIDGVLQLRNVANATATPLADGNYQELDSLIKLNVADAVNDRTYAVVSTEALAEKPTESMLADLESVQGQIDVMVQDLALATGNPETKYQATPNNVDLRAFGDRVLGLESEVSILEDPTLMDDELATKMGLKSYSHGTTYNAGIAPTISLFSGGGAFTSVTRSAFIPYQMQDGSWRLKFNYVVLLNGQSRTQVTMSIVGLEFSGAGISCFSDGIAHALTLDATSRMQASYATTVTGSHFFSGDVPLISKPTWAY